MRRLRKGPRRQHAGVAAVELALVFPVLLFLLFSVMFLGRYLMAYTVVQKSAQSAARYMSTIRVEEMKSPILAAAANDTAVELARTMLADLRMENSETIEIHCGAWNCVGGNTPPQTVRVMISFRMKDDIFNWVETGDYGWEIKAEVTRKYVGY